MSPICRSTIDAMAAIPHNAIRLRATKVYFEYVHLETGRIARRAFLYKKKRADGEHTDIERPEPRFQEPSQQIRKHRADGDGEWDGENQPQNRTPVPKLKEVEGPPRHIPWGEYEWEEGKA